MKRTSQRRKLAVLLGAAVAIVAGLGLHAPAEAAKAGEANKALLLLRGTPTGRPVLRQTLAPADLQTLLTKSAPQLLQLAGTPKCTISIYALGYHTIGGRNEPTTAGTAIMLPSGPAADCRGRRPVALVAHGTSVDKNYDLTSLAGDINGQNEGLTSAAFYAAQGFVVVLPNYAGYANSTLGYAPFLNAEQQSADMIDALRASRLVFPRIALNTLLGKLFITGYSQGGHVAMATLRAMQRGYPEFQVAAAATGSGPYAVSALIEKEIDGAPSTLAPLLFNLIATSWQKSYGNVYVRPSDLYAPQYAGHAENLLPGTVPQNTLFAQNVLPAAALFQTGSLPPPDTSNPDTNLVVQSGFAPTNFFIATRFRNAIVADAAATPCNRTDGGTIVAIPCTPRSGLRQDALRNDLRTFVPSAPLQMCGIHSDSLVYFLNTQAMASYLISRGVPASRFAVIDLDPGNAVPSGPNAALQQGFLDARARLKAQLGDDPTAPLQLQQAGHVLASPFCTRAARDFFLRML